MYFQSYLVQWWRYRVQTRIGKRKENQTFQRILQRKMNAVIWCTTKSNQDSIYNLDEITTENSKLGIETLRNQIKIQFTILMNLLHIGNWNLKIGKKSISNYEERNLDFNMLKNQDLKGDGLSARINQKHNEGNF